ncbi:MAG: hypothetical protein ACREDD_13445, partial [Methylocella sp.]
MKPKDEPESGYLTRRLIIRKTRMVITIIRNERTAPPPRLESLETAIRQEAVIWPLSAAVAVPVQPCYLTWQQNEAQQGVGFTVTLRDVIPTAREPDSWGDSQTAANVTRCSPSLIRGAGSMSAIEITRQ